MRSRLKKYLPAAILAVALAAASWPAWRVWMLGDAPTIDELLQLACAPRPRA
jgi:hypothetical protein